MRQYYHFHNPWARPPASPKTNKLLSLIVSFIFLLTFNAAAAQENSPAQTNPDNSEIEIRDTQDNFTSTLTRLTQRSFNKKTAAVEQLIRLDDPRVLPVLKAMLNNQLYYRKQDKLMVFANKTEEGFKAIAVENNQDLGILKKSKLKKISTNNKLRKTLRGMIAGLSLTNTDADVRTKAVEELMDSVDEDTLALVQKAMTGEQNPEVLQTMKTFVALSNVDHSDKFTRLQAVEQLGDSLHTQARNKLVQLLQKDANGNFIETDTDVRKAATKALGTINAKLDSYKLIETVFFGLSLGSVLLLAAIGLAITFGVMGVINMAHGELIMLGAYTTYVVQLLMPDTIEYSLFVAIPAAFIVSGLVGIAIERGVIQFLYGRPLETLLATFGISLVLQQLVRTIFSPLNRAVETPAWMSGAMEINSALSLTYNRFYIIIFSLMVFFALLAILKKTSLGLHVRAVSQNRNMAKAMGIKTGKVDALTFGLGSGIAGVAGVALSQLTNVGPNLGQAYIIDSFMVVVFGGVGNLWGTLVGAMSLGVVNKFLEPWSGAVLAKILVLVFIILFIQKKPRGLFPQKGRAAEA